MDKNFIHQCQGRESKEKASGQVVTKTESDICLVTGATNVERVKHKGVEEWISFGKMYRGEKWRQGSNIIKERMFASQVYNL